MLPIDQRLALVKLINGQNLSYKATVYAQLYDQEQQEHNMMLAQAVESVPFNPSKDVLDYAQKYIKTKDTFDIKELETNFRWDDVKGVDFTGKVRN